MKNTFVIFVLLGFSCFLISEELQEIELTNSTIYEGDYRYSYETAFHQTGSKTICFNFTFDGFSEIRSSIVGNSFNGGWLVDIDKSNGLGFRTNADSRYSYWFPQNGQNYKCVVVYDHDNENVKIFINDVVILDTYIVPMSTATPRPLHIGTWYIGDRNDNLFLGTLNQLQIYNGVASEPEKWDGSIESLGSGVTEVLSSKDGSGELNDNNLSIHPSLADNFSNQVVQNGRIELKYSQNQQFQLILPAQAIPATLSIETTPLDVSIDENLIISYVWNDFSLNETSFDISFDDALGNTYTSKIKLQLPVEDTIELIAANSYNGNSYNYSYDDIFKQANSYTFCFNFTFDGYNPSYEGSVVLSNRWGGGYKIDLNSYWGLSFLTGSGHLPTFWHPVVGQNYSCVITYDHTLDNERASIFIDGILLAEAPIDRLDPATVPLYLGAELGPYIDDSRFRGSLSMLQIYHGLASSPASWDGTEPSLGGDLNPLLISDDGSGFVNETGTAVYATGDELSFDNQLIAIDSFDPLESTSGNLKIIPPPGLNIVEFNLIDTNLGFNLSNDGYLTYNYTNEITSAISLSIELIDADGTIYQSEIFFDKTVDQVLEMSFATQYDGYYRYSYDTVFESESSKTICFNFIFDEMGVTKSVIFGNVNNPGGGWVIGIDPVTGLYFQTNTEKLNSHWFPEFGHFYKCVAVYDHSQGNENIKVYIDDTLVLNNKIDPITGTSPTPFHIASWMVGPREDNLFKGYLNQIQIFDGIASTPEKWDGTKESLGGTLTDVLYSKDGSGENNVNNVAIYPVQTEYYYDESYQIGNIPVNLGENRIFRLEFPDQLNVQNVQILPTYLDVGIDSNKVITYVWNEFSETITNFKISFEDHVQNSYIATIKIDIQSDQIIDVAMSRTYDGNTTNYTHNDLLKNENSYTYCFNFTLNNLTAPYQYVVLSNRHGSFRGNKISINSTTGLTFHVGTGSVSTNWFPNVDTNYDCVIIYNDTTGSENASIYINGSLILQSPITPMYAATTAFRIGAENDTNTTQFLGELSQIQVYHGIAATPQNWDGTQHSLGESLIPLLLSCDGSGVINETGLDFYGSDDINYDLGVKSVGTISIFENDTKVFKINPPPQLKITNYYLFGLLNLDLKISNDGYLTYRWNDFSTTETSFSINMTDASSTVYTLVIDVLAEQPPVWTFAEPIKINSGEIANLGDHISVSDPNEQNSNLVITIIDAPSSGTLSLGGLNLSNGSQFFADQLNSVSYVHDGTSTNASDSFTLNVTDSSGISPIDLKVNLPIDLNEITTAPYRFLKLSIDQGSINETTQIREVHFFQGGTQKTPIKTIDQFFFDDLNGLATIDGDLSSTPFWTINSSQTPSDIIYDFETNRINPTDISIFCETPDTAPIQITLHGSNDNQNFKELITLNSINFTSNHEKLAINIINSNSTLTAVNDVINMTPGSPITFNVVENDLSGANGVMDISSFGQPTYGTVNHLGDGVFEFTPQSSTYIGAELFTYTLSNGEGETSQASVTVNVFEIDQTRFIDIDSPESNFESHSTTITLSGTINMGDKVVLFLNGNELTGVINYVTVGDIQEFSSEISGLVDGDNHIRANVLYSDDFDFVNIQYIPPVIAVDDSIKIVKDSIVTFSLIDNDFDRDNSGLTITSIDPISNGSITLNSDGTIEYETQLSFTGQVSTTYYVENQDGFSTQADIKIEIVETALEAEPTFISNLSSQSPNTKLPISFYGNFDGLSIDPSSSSIQFNGNSYTPSISGSSFYWIYLDSIDDGTYSFSYDFKTLDGKNITDSFNLIIDGTKPDVSFDNINTNGQYNSTPISINGSYSDAGSGIVQDDIKLYLNGEEQSLTKNTSSFSCTLDPGDGIHTVSIVLNDEVDNFNSTSSVLIVDTEPPEFTDFSVVDPSSRRPLMKGKINDLSEITTITIDIEGEYTIEGENFYFIPSNQFDPSTATSINITLVDALGNQTDYTFSLELSYTPPDYGRGLIVESVYSEVEDEYTGEEGYWEPFVFQPCDPFLRFKIWTDEWTTSAYFKQDYVYEEDPDFPFEIEVGGYEITENLDETYVFYSDGTSSNEYTFYSKHSDIYEYTNTQTFNIDYTRVRGNGSSSTKSWVKSLVFSNTNPDSDPPDSKNHTFVNGSTTEGKTFLYNYDYYYPYGKDVDIPEIEPTVTTQIYREDWEETVDGRTHYYHDYSVTTLSDPIYPLAIDAIEPPIVSVSEPTYRKNTTPYSAYFDADGLEGSKRSVRYKVSLLAEDGFPMKVVKTRSDQLNNVTTYEVTTHFGKGLDQASAFEIMNNVEMAPDCVNSIYTSFTSFAPSDIYGALNITNNFEGEENPTITLSGLKLRKKEFIENSIVIVSEDESPNYRIISSPPGWTIDAGNGIITGNELAESGFMKIEAFDPTYSGVKKETSFKINLCGACECEPDIRVLSIKFAMTLGVDENGQEIGQFIVSEEKITKDTAKITSFNLIDFNTTDNAIRLISSDNMHKIYETDKFRAEINQIHEQKYDFKLVDVNNPSIIYGYYTFENPEYPNGIYNKHLLTKNINGIETTYFYEFNDSTSEWSMIKSDSTTQLKSTVVEMIHNGMFTKVFSKEDLNTSDVLEHNCISYINCGESLLPNDQIGDLSNMNIATNYSYGLDSSLPSFGKLTFYKDENNHWEKYRYNHLGLVSEKIIQFYNNTDTTLDHENHKITYSYIGIDSIDDGSKESLPRTEIYYTKGVETKRIYRIVTNNEIKEIYSHIPGASYNNLNNKFVITKYFDDGKVSETIDSKNNTTKNIYLSVANQSFSYVLSGISNNSGSFISGTNTITVKNDWGTILETKSVDIETGTVLNHTIYSNLDSKHRPLRIDYLDGTFEELTYSCCGLESKRERDGSLTTWTRYDDGSVESETKHGITRFYLRDALGRVIEESIIDKNGVETIVKTTNYNLAGEVESVTNSKGETTTYSKELDSDGYTVNTTTYHDGSTSITKTCADGKLYQTTGTRNITKTYEYGINTDGTEWKKEYVGLIGDAEWTKTTRDLQGQVIEVERANGATSTSEYNTDGQIVKSVDFDGVTTLYSYLADGTAEYVALDINQNDTIDLAGPDQISQSISDLSTYNSEPVYRTRNYTWFEGSSTGNLISTTYRSIDGQRSWSEVNGLVSNSVTTIDSSNETKTAVSSSPLGLVSTKNYADGLLTDQNTVDAGGNTVSSITYTYDELNRVLSQTDHTGRTTTFVYNGVTNERTSTTVTGGALSQTTTISEEADNVRKSTLADGTDVFTQQNLQGQIIKRWGSRVYPVEYTYENGRIKTMTTWKDFDTSDGAATTTWNYDIVGNLESKVDDEGKATTYTYTDGGKLKTRTWARGIVTTYLYDTAGRLEQTTFDDGTDSIFLTYDRLGRKTSVTDASGTKTFSYNTTGQLISESMTSGLFSGYEVTQTIDGFGRKNSFTLNNGLDDIHSTSFEFDIIGRLSTFTHGDHEALYSFHHNGQVDSLVFSKLGTGIVSSNKTFDALGRLTNVHHSDYTNTVQSFAYDMNDANQRTKVTEADNSYWLYTYDEMGQLTSGQKYLENGTVIEGLSFGFQYDDIGNREQSTINNQTASYTTNSINQYTQRDVPGVIDIVGMSSSTNVTVNDVVTVRNEDYYSSQVSLDNSVTIPYAIEIKEDSVLTATQAGYLQANPESFSYDADGNMTEDGLWYYYWNGENQLIRQVHKYDDLELQYSYDFKGLRFRKRVLRSGILDYERRYLYHGWNKIAELDENNQLVLTYMWGLDLSGSIDGVGGVGGLLAVTDHIKNKTYYPLMDGNGNIKSYIDSDSRQNVYSCEYSPFGKILYEEGQKVCDYGFSTKPLSPESGLVEYEMRPDYNPDLGRFIQEDPLGIKGGINLYNFVSNDPIGKVDVLGNYQRDTHGFFTYFVALILGASPEKAKSLGFFAWGPDAMTDTNAITVLNTFSKPVAERIQEDYHGLTGGNAAQLRAASFLENLIRPKTSDMHFGFLIHLFQDSYAHTVRTGSEPIYGTGTTLYTHWIGHGLHGESPDLVSHRPYLFREMSTLLLPMIANYLENPTLKIKIDEYPKYVQAISEVDDHLREDFIRYIVNCKAQQNNTFKSLLDSHGLKRLKLDYKSESFELPTDNWYSNPNFLEPGLRDKRWGIFE